MRHHAADGTAHDPGGPGANASPRRRARGGRRCLALVLALLCFTCPGTGHATDLGEGNAAMKERFEAWQAKGTKARASDAKRRVMITGFGLFSGVDYNISGVAVASMADPAFWPDKTRLATLPEATEDGLADGRLADTDLGARLWQRTLEIDGVSYEVCFLVLDVLWDLGAAIVLEQAKRFKPHLLVMTGRGGRRTVFEAGAVNHATRHSGFAWDGVPDPANLPKTPHVVDPALPGVEAAIAMRWNGPELARAVRPIIEGMGRGHTVYAAPRARPENNYICNNISCAVLHGIARKEVALAGGEIQVRGVSLPDTKAGFLHLPAAAARTPTEVQAWCHVFARVMQRHFELEAAASEASAPAEDAPEGD